MHHQGGQTTSPLVCGIDLRSGDNTRGHQAGRNADDRLEEHPSGRQANAADSCPVERSGREVDEGVYSCS